MLFVKLPYTLATEEAERIGLDHVARFVFNVVQIKSEGFEFCLVCGL